MRGDRGATAHRPSPPSQHEESPSHGKQQPRSDTGGGAASRKSTASAAEVAAAGRRSAQAELAKASQAQARALEAQKDRVKALRAGAAAGKPAKQLSPLVMAKLKKAEERARRRTVGAEGAVLASLLSDPHLPASASSYRSFSPPSAPSTSRKSAQPKRANAPR